MAARGAGHWNTVIIDGSLPESMIKDVIEDSYDLVVGSLPEPARRVLGWQPGEQPAQLTTTIGRHLTPAASTL